MSQIQNFSFEGSNVRSMNIDGEPHFVAKDICDVLALSNSRTTIQRLDQDDVSSTYVIDSLSRKQETTVVNESGLYSLILTSRKPEAKRFKRWITSEVLPTIRKHGAFITDDTLEKALNNPDFLIQLASRLKEEKEARMMLETKTLILEQRIAEYDPKVTYYDQILKSEGLISITQIAKDYGLSGQVLNRILYDEGIQYKKGDQWFLYSDYQHHGYTMSKTHLLKNGHAKMSTRWTQKGRLKIHLILEKRGISPTKVGGDL